MSQIAAGEFYVVRDRTGPIATFRLAWDDPRFWGPQPPVAGYLHKLAVRSRAAHRGIGRSVVEWAARRALARRRSFLRLDCSRANARLVAHYASMGFVKVRAVRRGPPGDRFWFQLMERWLRAHRRARPARATPGPRPRRARLTRD